MASIHGFRTPPPTVSHVSVAAVPVRYLFSGEFRFQLPWFQRAYAWTPAQIAGLASGIRDTMKAHGGRDPYPLGTLMLARRMKAIETAVVDGHQRLMTLTILLAVLRDLEPDADEAAALHALVADPEAPESWRLTALADAASLLVASVQTPGATAEPPEADWCDLSMSERHIIENRDFLHAEFLRLLPKVADRRAFAAYLLDKCWVIVHIADDEDEAWRRLRLDEDTRLEFDAENRAKASLLSLVPREQRQAAADGWARCEQILPPSELVALLHHLRLLDMGPKARKRPIEIDIAEHFDLRHRGLEFIDDRMLPMARRMRALIDADTGNAAADRSLASLGWLGRQLWMPPALLWQATCGGDTEATADFYFRLDRLMWVMRIGGVDPTRQERRLWRIIDHIRDAAAVHGCEDLEIEPKLYAGALVALRSPKLGTRRFLGVLLRRLSLTLGADPGPVDPCSVTIEHLLPRNPKRGSDWGRTFRGKKHIDGNAYRLGNLTFMTHDENQAAGSHDWPLKRNVLAKSAFVLSHGLADAETWTADAIEARGERLVTALFTEWRLPVA